MKDQPEIPAPAPSDNETGEASDGSSCSLSPEVIRTLHHCRLFIGERRGYRQNEEMERDDICRRIDAIISANAEGEATPPVTPTHL
jgi:hypothetical protein